MKMKKQIKVELPSETIRAMTSFKDQTVRLLGMLGLFEQFFLRLRSLNNSEVNMMLSQFEREMLILVGPENLPKFLMKMKELNQQSFINNNEEKEDIKCLPQ
jgi:hypothetical protein